MFLLYVSFHQCDFVDWGPQLQDHWPWRRQCEGANQQEGIWNTAQLWSGNINDGLFFLLFNFSLLIIRVYERWYLPAAYGPQLKRQIDEEAVFVGFVEGEIDFQPTYKYDTGSDKWDTR